MTDDRKKEEEESIRKQIENIIKQVSIKMGLSNRLEEDFRYLAPAAVSCLIEQQSTTDTRKRKQIENRLWENWRYIVFFHGVRYGMCELVTLIDFSHVQEENQEAYRKIIQKNEDYFFSSDLRTTQKKYSVGWIEQRDINAAASWLKLPESAFVLRSAHIVASFILSYPFEKRTHEQLLETLKQAHALRETKLFTADEIRKLELTGKQGEIFGEMLALKQPGLPGAVKP